MVVGELVYKITGDSSALKKSVSDVNQEGQKSNSVFSKLGPIIKIAFSVAAVKSFLDIVKKTTAAADVQIQAERRLAVALNGRVGVQQRLIKQAEEIQSRTTFGDEEIISQQAFLASLQLSEEQIAKTIEASIQLSTVTGKDLRTSVELLSRTFSGQVGRLSQYGAEFRDLTQEQLKNGEAVDLVAQKWQGFAEEAAEAGLGPTRQLSNTLGDLSETIGYLFLPAVQDASKFLNGLVIQLISFLDITKEARAEAERQGRAQEEQAERTKELIKLAKKRNAELSAGLSINEKERILLGEIGELEKEILELYKDNTLANIELADAKSVQIRIIRKAIDLLYEESQAQKTNAASKRELTDAEKQWLSERKSVFAAIDQLDRDLNMSERERIAFTAEQKIEQLRKYAKANEDISREIAIIQQEENRKITELDAIEQEKRTQKQREEIQKRLADAQTYFSSIASFANSINDLQSSFTNSRLQEIDRQFKREKNAIEQSGLSQEERVARIAKAEEEYNKKKAEELERQAIFEKAIKIFNAGVGTASAIIQVISSTPPYAWPALIPLAAATGAVQTAAIIAEPIPKYATGGIVPGNSTSGDNVIARVNSGEMILNQQQQSQLFNMANSGGLSRVAPLTKKAMWDDIFRASQSGELFIADRAVVTR